MEGNLEVKRVMQRVRRVRARYFVERRRMPEMKCRTVSTSAVGGSVSKYRLVSERDGE